MAADIAAARLDGDIAAPNAVAATLGTTVGALASMRYRHTGPPYSKIGGKVIYRWSEIEKYLAARTVEPTE